MTVSGGPFSLAGRTRTGVRLCCNRRQRIPTAALVKRKRTTSKKATTRKPARSRIENFSIYRGSSTNQSRTGLADRQGDVHQMLKSFRSIVFACINARAQDYAGHAKFIVKRRVSLDEY